ncbi:MAG: nucleoside monophosphate kinase [Defluviitaleaceae bacterium]|nr:nucleoside monophosphate kinase [Defluviitaleaceae bacterium]
MRLIILGASGAGKGTQAQAIASHFGVRHISSGDFLREETKADTALCRAVKRLIDRGDLVPDELMLSMMHEILEGDNFILDGFPRTFAQALALDEICGKLGCQIDMALNIHVPDDEVIQRITGRKVCPDCKAMFHIIFYPPKQNFICDHCGGRLEQRPDDTASTVRNRLKIYHERTLPIIDFYQRQNLLISTGGVGDADEITGNLIRLLEERLGKNGHCN